MAKILVVDDSGVDRTIAGAFVEKMGASVLFAENGKIALDVMQNDEPDAVLTDLQMPEMDGLDLVKNLRRIYPGTPVILMTAYGSEEIAVNALQAGAVSYVAKKNLKQDLAEAVESVLATVAARDERQKLQNVFSSQVSTFEVGYEEGSQAALINHLQEDLKRISFGDPGDIMHVGMALTEALANAIDHGNLELDSTLREETNSSYRELGARRSQEPLYANRRVKVTAYLSSVEIKLVIQDQGPGFDPSKLPDPTDPENLLKASGRGIMLIKTFMDEVTFSPKGNEITMIKRRRTPE